MFKALFKAMRPRQWTKNGAVMAALVFDGQLLQPAAFWHTVLGALLFCLTSSSVYILNDLNDLEADRRHPVKRRRPIASGALPIPLARAAALLFASISLSAGWLLSPSFSLVILTYMLLMLAYSHWLKHIPVLDVLAIAAGFVLRVHAGVTLIRVERFSPWLYIVTTLLALYLGFGKRRAELTLLEQNAGDHRKALGGYSIALLDQYITIVSGTTIVAYALYTFSAPNLPPNHSMMLTIPFVIYGIFRYLYLVQIEAIGGEPEEVLLRDRPLQAAIVLWALSVLLIFYGNRL